MIRKTLQKYGIFVPINAHVIGIIESRDKVPQMINALNVPFRKKI